MKYDYGDLVRVHSDAPNEFHPNAYGEVVGMVKVPGSRFGLPDEEVMRYTIEFIDGSSIGIPEQFLEPYKDDTQ